MLCELVPGATLFNLPNARQAYKYMDKVTAMRRRPPQIHMTANMYCISSGATAMVTRRRDQPLVATSAKSIKGNTPTCVRVRDSREWL